MFMNTSNYIVSLDDKVQQDEIVVLYTANGWSSAEKPELLIPALNNSHSLVTARDANGFLIGVGNAISDGYLVVYYPHMLVDPTWQGKGVGKAMMEAMQSRYAGFHQQMLTADGDAIGFYKALGFERAGQTEPMWIYAGNEH
jgi:GNAT superfamily N-acetyltransferase